MRTLIVISIILTEQDMGSLLEQTKQAYVSRYGHQKWIDHLKSIDEVWTGIRQMITALELPYSSVRLYQDGLPVCGREEDIVKDVVEAMASHRPYRAALGIDSALKEIERGRGTVYDAAVVDACSRLFSEKLFVFSS